MIFLLDNKITVSIQTISFEGMHSGWENKVNFLAKVTKEFQKKSDPRNLIPMNLLGDGSILPHL